MLSLKLLKISLKEIFSLRLIKLMIIPFLIYYFADNFGENAFIKELDFSGESFGSFFNNQNLALIVKFYLLHNFVEYGFIGAMVSGLKAIKESSKVNPIVFFDPRKVFRLFKVAFLNGLMISLGLLCLVIPGIMVDKRNQYCVLLAAEDKSLKPFEAIQKSKKISLNKGWYVYISILLLVMSDQLFSEIIMKPLFSTNFLFYPIHLLSKWILFACPITLLFISKEKFQSKDN